MSDYGRRLRALETLYQASEEPPTRCFFTIELFQAAANYDNQPPERVREDVQQVEDAIAYWDRLRIEHQLDVIDFAIVLVRAKGKKRHSQSADGIGGMVCFGHWNWDEERRGESYASRPTRRSREAWESIVAARLSQRGEPELVLQHRQHDAWLDSLSDDDMEFLAGIAEHLKADGLRADMDAADRDRLDTLEATWPAFEATYAERTTQ